MWLFVFQGDGISYETLSDILENMKKHKWSADNIAFGSGGNLLIFSDVLFDFKPCNGFGVL